MNLNQTPNANRVHIGIFGRRNAGKSSVINAITGQNLAIVSDVAGTTTDPVSKAMEILPLGPVVIIDTPGLDDVGELGEMRVQKAYQVLNKTDIALVVADGSHPLGTYEIKLIERIKAKKIPYLIVVNKTDIGRTEVAKELGKAVYVSAKTGENINELKEAIAAVRVHTEEIPIISDLIDEGDCVVLVIPIDEAAPKGRLILPQQQTLREILDKKAVAVVTQVETLDASLKGLSSPPKLVVTGSQAFAQVSKIVPKNTALTSFSILFARHKGELSSLLKGADAVSGLKDGDSVLISEGCTHHRQCNDIGSVKIPKWLEGYTGKKLNFVYTSGAEFPLDLTPYSLIVHCGGCMLSEREMKFRIACAEEQNVPIINYGMLIAYINGILQRSTEVLKKK